MSAKLTPGPWSIRTEFGKLCIRPGDYNAKGYSSGYAPIAKVAGDKRINNDEANARLIAAAPGLLAVLERVQSMFSYQFEGGLTGCMADLSIDVRAAIAKATGEQQ